MLYAQNGVTDAELRHDEHGHMKHALREKSTGGRGDPGWGGSRSGRSCLDRGSGGSHPTLSGSSRSNSGELEDELWRGGSGSGERMGAAPADDAGEAAELRRGMRHELQGGGGDRRRGGAGALASLRGGGG